MKSAQWTSLLATCGLALLVWFLVTNPEPQKAGVVELAEAKGMATNAAVPAVPALNEVQEATQPPLAALPVAQSLFAVKAWMKAKPDLRPLAPEEPKAAREVIARGELVPGSLPQLQAFKTGDVVSLPLRMGGRATGVVNLVQPDETGWVRVGGSVKSPGKGSFSLGQKGDEWTGLVQLPEQDIALVIDTAQDGTMQILEKPLSSVVCKGMPKKPLAVDDLRKADGGGGGSASASALPAPEVPLLDNLPAATAVIYIDFDGELVTDPDWNDGYTINALPARLGSKVISAAQITNIWQRVCEDMRPFNVSVTTIRSRYDAAPVGKRMRCVVTATDYWFPGAGGVAYLESFNQGGSGFSSTVPCWAFVASYYTTADIAGIISHEVGHTFGLEHDNEIDADGKLIDEYYAGHANWGAIMGVTYGRAISQWSKGEYKSAGNFEDDLAIIGNGTNGFGLITDETPVTQLPNSGVFNAAGIVSSAADTDVFRFETAGGLIQLKVNAAPIDPNLNVKVDLLDATGSIVLQSVSPTGTSSATLLRALVAGEYRIRVQGAGEGDPLGTGFTAYGSVGAYTLGGTFPAIPDEFPFIIGQPQPVDQMVGSKVTFSVQALSNTALSYQWQRNGVDIPRATGVTHVISRAQPANEGDYRCVVTNGFDSVISDPAALTLHYKPLFLTHPTRTVAGTGQTVTLSAQVQATSPLTLQWQKDKINIAGANSPDLVLPDVEFLDGGSYRCVATNNYGVTLSRPAVLSVTSAPVITLPPPATLGVPLGGSAVIPLQAVGSPTLKYQWYQDNVLLRGATRAALTLTRISASSAGDYRCEVSNVVAGVRQTVSSTNCTVTPGVAPRLLSQPQALVVDAEQSFELRTTATGEPTLTYQWLRDGVPVGPNATSYFLLSAQWEDQASYRVQVSNAFGSTISRAVTVKVNAAPKVVESPANQKVARGGRTTLTVTATGSPTLKYQWRRNGVTVRGATSSRLILVGSETADYDCVVSNALASDTSLPCTVTVEEAPVIARLPTVAGAALNGTFQLTASATGADPLTYEWRRNNIPLPGQTAAQLSLSNLQPADAGTYTVVVSNDVGSKTSTPMRLSLTTAVAITTPPQDTTVYAFESATFSVSATGGGKLSYQWLRNGMEIPGATKTQLSIASAQTNAAYSVRVTNPAGGLISAPAQLTVIPVTAPTLTSLAPRRANAGHYLRLVGTGLKWTTQVRFEAASGGLVNAGFVIVSDTELLVTVPAGTAANKTVQVTTRGGSAATPLPQSFTAVSGPPNDLFVNARVIMSTGARVLGTLPTSFKAEVGEPHHAYNNIPNLETEYKATYSAWHAFTPTRSGTHSVSTSGSSFDTRIAVYTGATVSTLTAVAANDDVDYDSGRYHSYTRFEAVAGTTYHIAVDGFDFNFFYAAGAYSLNVAYVTGVAIEGAPAMTSRPDSGGVTLGGVGVTEAALAWAGADGIESGLPLHEAVTQFTFSAPTDGSADAFGWTAYDVQGNPVLGLGMDPQTRELLVVDVQGVTSAVGQILVPGADYELRFWKDPDTGNWGALLNGEWIIPALPLAPGVELSDLSVQWRPGGTGSGLGNLEVKSLETLSPAP